MWIVMLQGGEYSGSQYNTFDPAQADAWPSYGDAKAGAEALVKMGKVLLSAENLEKAIVPYALASTLYKRAQAERKDLETKLATERKRIVELEAAAKKDPYTVAAVDAARKMEAHLADTQKLLTIALADHGKLCVVNVALRRENDDLKRKLGRQ